MTYNVYGDFSGTYKDLCGCLGTHGHLWGPLTTYGDLTGPMASYGGLCSMGTKRGLWALGTDGVL